jgi:putative ABC transport system permease protein
VLASEAFVEAHGFVPGDACRRHHQRPPPQLEIVGVVLSPEYVYSIRPARSCPTTGGTACSGWAPRAGERVRHGGRLQRRVAALRPGASPEAAIAALDRLIEPYGGLGAIPRAQQMSVWTLENELMQLQSFGFVTPAIFLAVAAFILNVALTRALALQRSQVAALKALGYSNGQLGWHYMKWALAIAAAGAARHRRRRWLGAGMIELYNEYFKFPALDYRPVAGSASARSRSAWPPRRSARAPR